MCVSVCEEQGGGQHSGLPEVGWCRSQEWRERETRLDKPPVPRPVAMATVQEQTLHPYAQV